MEVAPARESCWRNRKNDPGKEYSRWGLSSRPPTVWQVAGGPDTLSDVLSSILQHPIQVAAGSCLLSSSLVSPNTGQWAVLGKLEPGKVMPRKRCLGFFPFFFFNGKEKRCCLAQVPVWFCGKDEGLSEGS